MCLLNSGHVPQLKRNPCAQTILNGEVHNWYRLRLGYSDHLVADLLEDFGLKAKDRVLDPFCGSGTSLVECMKKGIDSTGIDANPASCFAATVKTNWLLRPETVLSLLDEVETSFERHLRRSSVLWTDPTFQDDRPACWNLWGNSSGSPGATSVDGWVTLCLFPARLFWRGVLFAPFIYPFFLGSQYGAGVEDVLGNLEADRVRNWDLFGTRCLDGDLRRPNTAFWSDNPSFFRLSENQETADVLA